MVILALSISCQGVSGKKKKKKGNRAFYFISKVRIQNSQCDQVLKTAEVSSGCDCLSPRMRTIFRYEWAICPLLSFSLYMYIFMLYH